MTATLERHDTDILILGSGGAGLFAALHAQQSAPEGTKITLAVKGLIGKCGCTRMVQGGYNVALGGGDTVERHFMDTINAGSGNDSVTVTSRPPEGTYYLVLLDVPCSNSGVLARRPMARHRFGPRALADLEQLQEEILHQWR